MSEPRYGVQSMVDPLRRVLIRRPATTGDFAAADWRQPDPARLIAEHEAFGELLESLGCEVTVAEPVEGMVDSVYVCDPVWTCGQGAIVLRSAKPARVGEGEAMVAPLEAAGVPIAGRLIGTATADGGDMVWLDNETLAVARGYRTNAEAHRQLDEILAAEGARTLRFDLPHDRGAAHVLHLMSFISPVTHNLAVVFEPLAPVTLMQELQERGIGIIPLGEDEYHSMGCNILATAPGVVVVLDGNPNVRRAMEAKGIEVHAYQGGDVSLKGDGGPTCLTRELLRRA
ncbi:MAG: amidinotransferase [Thermoleophilia bacterium]|jgi:N-dimethylarginine dimethylaminohydrolase|nr:amidinotransferase [Thermoleophilia bacterium]